MVWLQVFKGQLLEPCVVNLSREPGEARKVWRQLVIRQEMLVGFWVRFEFSQLHLLLGWRWVSEKKPRMTAMFGLSSRKAGAAMGRFGVGGKRGRKTGLDTRWGLGRGHLPPRTTAGGWFLFKVHQRRGEDPRESRTPVERPGEEVKPRPGAGKEGRAECPLSSSAEHIIFTLLELVNFLY